MESIVMIAVRLFFCQCLYVFSHQLSLSTTDYPAKGNNNNRNHFFPVPKARPTSAVQAFRSLNHRGTYGPHTTGINMPHCSECFGHAVNKSIDPRCKYGCVGNELPSTGPYRAGAPRPTHRWIPKFGRGAKLVPREKNSNRRMSNANIQPSLRYRHSTPLPTVVSSSGGVKVSTQGNILASSSNKMAAMRVTKSQVQEKDASLSRYRDKSVRPKEEEVGASELPVYDKLNKQKQEDEEQVLLSYKKYIKTSSIVIVAAIFGGVAITAFVVYRKHAKRKQKIHSFQSIELA